MKTHVDKSFWTQGLAQSNAMKDSRPRSGMSRLLQAMVNNSPRRVMQWQAALEEETLV